MQSLILCYVLRPRGLSAETERSSPGCVFDFVVKELQVDRWLARPPQNI
jgi:hypothetical protein